MKFIRPETVRDPHARQEVELGSDRGYLVMNNGDRFIIGEKLDGTLILRAEEGVIILSPGYSNEIRVRQAGG
jgi:hypothetical protein